MPTGERVHLRRAEGPGWTERMKRPMRLRLKVAWT